MKRREKNKPKKQFHSFLRKTKFITALSEAHLIIEISPHSSYWVETWLGIYMKSFVLHTTTTQSGVFFLCAHINIILRPLSLSHVITCSWSGCMCNVYTISLIFFVCRLFTRRYSMWSKKKVCWHAFLQANFSFDEPFAFHLPCSVILHAEKGSGSIFYTWCRRRISKSFFKGAFWKSICLTPCACILCWR